MGIKRSLFTCVKRLFTHSSKPKSQEKSKNWRWLVKKMKFRQDYYYYPAIKEVAPKTLNEAAEEQRKQAVVVAVATAAAAEAAVAAANAAAEVVRLANKPNDVENKTLYLEAIKIQTAYRGHLARKALSALKGIVKLQAVVRGELVRKSAVAFFSPLLVHPNRTPPLPDYLSHAQKRRSFVLSDGLKYQEFKLQSKSHRSLDLSSEASTKREFMRRYSFSHMEKRNDQSLQAPMTVKRSTSTRFDQLHELKPMLRMNTIAVDTNSLEKLKISRENKIVEDLNLPNSQSTRLFCRPTEDYGSLPNSPVYPAYMAATESTKAKSRSFSTPRQRMKLCEMHSPCRLSLSSGGSFNGELITKK